MEQCKDGSLSVWQVFEEYANVRDDLEEALFSFDYIQEEIHFAMSELSEELDSIRKRLQLCDHTFKRYKTGRTSIL